MSFATAICMIKFILCKSSSTPNVSISNLTCTLCTLRHSQQHFSILLLVFTYFEFYDIITMVFLVCKLVSLSDDEREFVTSTFGIE